MFVGRIYRFINKEATTKSLSIYPTTATDNGTNVVLRGTSATDTAQQWIWTSQNRLVCVKNALCLDRYNSSSSTQHDNADVWQCLDSENANQELAYEDYGTYIKIKLKATNLYLTAYDSASGSATGNTVTSSGNVYWATSSSSNYQRWEAVLMGNNNYRWPTESRNVTNEYTGSSHLGIDFGAIVPRVNGDQVFAYTEGTVLYAGYGSNEGNTIRIQHNDPLNSGKYIRTQYMHLSSSALYSAGQSVRAGALIGYMGDTGRSTATHLHFEVRRKDSDFTSGNVYAEGTVVDPESYLNLT